MNTRFKFTFQKCFRISFSGVPTSGGTQVTSTTSVKITANQTLYARWEAKYDCRCSNCANKVSTYNSYCSTCSSYSKCSSSGSCTYHCTTTHYCKCNACSTTVSCNTSQCSTCDSYSECTNCYNCGYHYSICSDCGYCSSCGCRCSSGGDSGGDTSCYCCGGKGGCHDTHIATITCGTCNIPAKAVSCTAGCWAYLDCVCVTPPDWSDMHNYDFPGKCEVCGL